MHFFFATQIRYTVLTAAVQAHVGGQLYSLLGVQTGSLLVKMENVLMHNRYWKSNFFITFTLPISRLQYSPPSLSQHIK